MRKIILVAKSKETLNDFLRTEIPQILKTEISNSKIRRLIISGNVFVNDAQIRLPSFVLKFGSEVEILLDEQKLFFEKPVDDIQFDLKDKDILFEDESVIVVNKPSHFPTEKGMVSSRDNLHDALVRFLFERQKIEHPNLKNPPYLGIMHRLDRDTSGVILFTKNRKVNSAFHNIFESHEVKKIYNAVVCVKSSGTEKIGINKEFSVEFPMGRISPKSQAAKWGRVDEKNGGVSSKTEFTILEEIPPKFFCNESRKQADFRYFFVECRPFTGRTHQIRVHLSSVGLPILGDSLYGGMPYKRIMLHAKSLSFIHPVTKESVRIEADIKNFLNNVDTNK